MSLCGHRRACASFVGQQSVFSEEGFLMRRSLWSLAGMFGALGSKWKSRKQRDLRPHKRRTFAAEPLEERTLLSVFHWTGGGGSGNWGTAANWQEGSAPPAGSNLYFSGSTRTPLDPKAGDGIA
jgi:hypothetical protein